MTGGPSTTVTGNVPTATARVAGSTAVHSTSADAEREQRAGARLAVDRQRRARRRGGARGVVEHRARRRWWRRRTARPAAPAPARRRRRVAMPTGSAGDGQLSTQPPPAGESTTWPNVSWCQPGVEVGERDLPVAGVGGARGPDARAVVNVDVGAGAARTPAPGCSAQLDAPEHQPGDAASARRAPAGRPSGGGGTRHRDAAPRRAGDAGEGAIVGVDLGLRRVRGRRRRLEEVQQMLARAAARGMTAWNANDPSGSGVGSTRHQRLDQPQRQAPQLLGDDQRPKLLSAYGMRAARDELADDSAGAAIDGRARARKLDGGRADADADEGRLAGGGAPVLRQRQLVPAGVGIDRACPRSASRCPRSSRRRRRCNECAITPAWPAPPRSQTCDRRRRAVPADREHVLRGIRAGGRIARRGASPAAAATAGACASTTTSQVMGALSAQTVCRRRASRARVGPLRQHQRVRAVAAHRNRGRRPGCRRRRTAARRRSPTSPARRLGAHRAAPDAAQHGERHLRRGLEDMGAAPRAHHRGRRRHAGGGVAGRRQHVDQPAIPVAPGGRSPIDRSGVGPDGERRRRDRAGRAPAGSAREQHDVEPGARASAPAAGANSARAGTTSRACRALAQASCVVTSAVPLSTARRIG